VGACLVGAPPAGLDGCSDTSIALTPHVSGTATFNADGTFEANLVTSFDFSDTFTASCLAGKGLSCSGLPGTGLPAYSATCSGGAGGACTCTYTLSVQDVTNMGHYVLGDAGVETYDMGSGSFSMYGYCVSGGYLHLLQTLYPGGVRFPVDYVFKH
jgi:hypothetical protein